MFNPVKVDGDKKEEKARETQNKWDAQELGRFPKLSTKDICRALLNRSPVQTHSPFLFLEVCPDDVSVPFFLAPSTAGGLKDS